MRVLAAVVLFAALPALAQVSSQGFVGGEARAFQPDDDDDTVDYAAGLAARVELSVVHRPWREQVRLFARADALDSSRVVAVVEEAYLGFRSRWVSFQLGAQLLNWTATEAFHPADVINSRNLDSNLENAEKLGEPMASLTFRFFEGEITGYYMPLRLDPLLPGGASRLSFAQGVKVGGQQPTIGEPLWMDRDGGIDDGLWAPDQWAVRMTQTFGSLDLAVQVVEHADRSQPTFWLDTKTLEARPLYHRVTHFGLTSVYAPGWGEGLIVKLEAAHRLFDEGQVDHTQLALGFEYGWEFPNGHEGIVLLEGQALIADEAERLRLSPFQRDVLVGYRHAFNDIDSKELILGWIVDLERWPEMLGTISYRQRLSDTWSLDTGLRLVYAPRDDAESFPTGLRGLHNSNYVHMTIKRGF